MTDRAESVAIADSGRRRGQTPHGQVLWACQPLLGLGLHVAAEVTEDLAEEWLRSKI